MTILTATFPEHVPSPPAVGQTEGIIQTCFHDSPYPALRNVRCTVHDGVAQLDGALPSFYLKQLAQEIVKQLNAVEEVANRIKVVAMR